MKTLLSTLLLTVALVGCGGAQESSPDPRDNPPLPPIEVPQADGGIVHGRAVYTVDSEQRTAMMKLFNSFLPSAYASTGTSTVTYTNAASTNFTISVLNFGAGAFTGDTLSLGSVSLSGLDDNSLKVCNPGGNTKCTQAVIRVYTTGSVAGFVNTADNYGVPVHAGSLNPSSQVGLNAAGSVQVQTYTIAGSKNRLKLVDLTTPTYNVTSDFSNAGSGPYSMTFVVEYVLFP